MRSEIRNITASIEAILEQHGFVPVEEFSDVNYLDYSGIMFAFISFEGSTVVAEALPYRSDDFCLETDHKLCLHLYGRAEDFSDNSQHMEACYEVFYDIVANPYLPVCKIELSKAVQSMPLRRLERRIELTVRTLEKAEVE